MQIRIQDTKRMRIRDIGGSVTKILYECREYFHSEDVLILKMGEDSAFLRPDLDVRLGKINANQSHYCSTFISKMMPTKTQMIFEVKCRTLMLPKLDW